MVIVAVDAACRWPNTLDRTLRHPGLAASPDAPAGGGPNTSNTGQYRVTAGLRRREFDTLLSTIFGTIPACRP
jgi:hypothetical protein